MLKCRHDIDMFTRGRIVLSLPQRAHVHWNWPISGEQISKINLVCKYAVALTPYGSCGLLVMGWLQLYEFQNWKDHISSIPKTLILKPNLRKVEINAWWFEFSKIRITVFYALMSRTQVLFNQYFIFGTVIWHFRVTSYLTEPSVLTFYQCDTSWCSSYRVCARDVIKFSNPKLKSH